MNFHKYFKILKDWKRLPAYRLEPRIDSFIGFFLPDILKENPGMDIKDVKIPELPIRLGTVDPEKEGTNHADRSYKVDFYVQDSDGLHYFIEVKSDMDSRRDSQDKYLKKSVECGMQRIVEGIIRIAEVSTYKKKYNYLKEKLRELGIIDNEERFTGSKNEIQVIYIQPRILKEDNDKRVIDFKTIAEILKKKYPSDEFVKEFAKALNIWSKD